MAPRTIERASTATCAAPSLRAVRARVARATGGAPAKIPAKLLGENTSTRRAKSETRDPPTMVAPALASAEPVLALAGDSPVRSHERTVDVYGREDVRRASAADKRGHRRHEHVGIDGFRGMLLKPGAHRPLPVLGTCVGREGERGDLPHGDARLGAQTP